MDSEARVKANEAAQSCADALVALHPDWEPHVRTEKIDGMNWVDLFFPNDEAIGPLTVEFDIDEINIFVSRYHRHLYFGGANGQQARIETSRIIEDLLADRLLVAFMVDGDEWLGSGLIESAAAARWNPAGNPDCLLTMLSWSGATDRTVTAGRNDAKSLFDLRPVEIS